MGYILKKTGIQRITLQLCLSFVSILYCGKVQNEQNLRQLISQNSTYDINRFVLEKLEENRIVMLADGGHGESLYMQRVIGFLNYWTDKIENPTNAYDSIPHDIIFIMESDSNYINRIESFFDSGNIVDVLKFGAFSSEKFTTSNIEFYSDLGRLKERIDEYNLNRDETRKIEFDLFGPEKAIDLRNWSFQKRSSFFLYEREEYSSDQITRILAEHPQAKALIFYGANHLKEGEILKRSGDQEAKGFYLAHYLREYFGEAGGIYTVNQVRPAAWKYYPHISEGPESTYVFDNSFLRGSKLNKDKVYDFTDATITIIENQEPPRAIRWIVSEKMIDFIMKNIRQSMNIENDFHRYGLAGAIQYLLMASGKEYEIFAQDDQHHAEILVKQWEAWYDSASFDIVGDIENMTLWERLLNLMADSGGEYIDSYELSVAKTISRKPFFDSTMSSQMRTEYYEDLLQEKRKQIVVENLIHLLWVGTDEEKERAISVLRNMTGENLATAKEWMVWWRNSFVKNRFD